MTIDVGTAAKRAGVSREVLCRALIDGKVDFGFAVKMDGTRGKGSSWRFIVFEERLQAYLEARDYTPVAHEPFQVEAENVG